MKQLLVIDNYDSFTYNLVQMFRRFDLAVAVHRNDTIDIDQVLRARPDGIVISPGPGAPRQAGISLPLVVACKESVPILGVCLGLQCINEVFGGRTVRSPLPVHGKQCLIHHVGDGIFRGVPSPFPAARYHSLMAAPRGDALLVTAEGDDGVIMGLSHRDLPIHGVQFHPESFLTEHGAVLIENFLYQEVWRNG